MAFNYEKFKGEVVARPSKYDWEEIRNAYECGIKIDKLVSKYGVTKKTLQNRISNELWEVTGNIKADIQAVDDSLGKITGTISQNPSKAHIIAEETLNSINELADKLDAKKLINGLSMMNLTRVMQHLEQNVKLEKINVGDGVQQFEPVGLGSADYKNIQDTIDRASVTLEVAPRYNPTTAIQINNEKQTQSNKRVVIARRSDRG